MTNRCLISASLALALMAHTALAGDVRMYHAGEIPNPRDVATILDAAPPVAPPIKMRSIRLIPDEQPVATRHEAELARQDAPEPSSRRTQRFRAAGAVRLRFGARAAGVSRPTLTQWPRASSSPDRTPGS